jgi:hypothetical protein
VIVATKKDVVGFPALWTPSALQGPVPLNLGDVVHMEDRCIHSRLCS